MSKQQARTGNSLQSMQAAGLRLLQTYTELAQANTHLLSNLFSGELPLQWQHYPHDDAIDGSSGYQWFYHAHSADERLIQDEHGHIHIFASRALWSRRLYSKDEEAFRRIAGGKQKKANTCHLLAISFSAKGLPISLFTVNSWVTGDVMLSRKLTLDLLQSIKLNTGYNHIDNVITSTILLYKNELQGLMAERDNCLANCKDLDKLNNHSLEVLSELKVDLDKKLF